MDCWSWRTQHLNWYYFVCRDAGKLRQEGKEYVVQDGDVMHFKFNV